MSRLQTFAMPDVGEGLTEAEVLSWHVAVGDRLLVNQVFVEIETAKAAVELPSPYAGRVHALLVEPGVTVSVGTPIISVDTDPDSPDVPPGDGPDVSAAPAAGGPSDSGPVAPAPAKAAASQGVPASDPMANGEVGAKIGEVMADGRIATLVGYVSAGAGTARRTRRVPGAPSAEPLGAQSSSAQSSSAQSSSAEPAGGEPLSAQPADAGLSAPEPSSDAPGTAPLAAPPVRKLAKDLGVDLHQVRATGPGAVITRADVEAAGRPGGSANGVVWAEPEETEAPSSRPGRSGGAREIRVPVKGVRRATAAAMVLSAFTAPHVTEFLTIDVTPMMALRDRLRQRADFADVKLTPLTFAARAVCLAARRTPEVNATWDEETGEIVVKHYVNLGIAAATPRGLIVPVVPDADVLDLAGLGRALVELTATARAGRTSPAQMSGGTFTITNVGVFGVDTGTPIINPGESAILALGSIKDAPWVVDGQLAVRKVCQLALSFDHRVVDGAQGSQFLADVGALLADPALALAY